VGAEDFAERREEKLVRQCWLAGLTRRSYEELEPWSQLVAMLSGGGGSLGAAWA